jgi:3-oxoacyl-[acyl-carrier-protein] synthase II
MHGKCRIGGRLPDYELPETTFESKIHSLAKALAIDVIEDAQFDLLSMPNRDKWRTGCLIANQYGVAEIRHETAGKLRLIKKMPHSVSSMLAMDYELRGYTGAPNGASVGSAIAIGEAYRLIRDGYMDRMLVGGLDFNCNQNVLPGMEAFGALCTTHNQSPEDASKPFDKQRSGAVVSDGGAMLMFESEESAQKRGAKKIYGEIAGYGQTNDAHNLLRPFENGLGTLAAIMNALKEAGMHPLELDTINCHARSTLSGDDSEAYCLHSLFACGN